jgi:hypothetical protein
MTMRLTTTTKAIIWLNTALLAVLPMLALMTIIAIANFENGDPPEVWGTAALAMPDTPPTSEVEDATETAQDDETAPVEYDYTTEAAIFVLQPSIDESEACTLATLINENAAANELDPLFVVAVIFGESGFNPKARNPRSGCAGLMQLHPCHHVANVYDPETNITFGCKLLKGYIDSRDGSLRRGLYRWGLTGKQAKAVISRYEKLKEQVMQQPYLIEIECQFCGEKFRTRNKGGEHGSCPNCERTYFIDTPQSDESGFVVAWDRTN